MDPTVKITSADRVGAGDEMDIFVACAVGESSGDGEADREGRLQEASETITRINNTMRILFTVSSELGNGNTLA